MEQKKKKTFLYNNFMISLRYLRQIKNYIWFSVILFFGVGVFTFFFHNFFNSFAESFFAVNIENEILKFISELIKQTEGLNTINLIRFIFINNLTSGFFALILGIFFGVVPFLISAVNGYVLGFVADKAIKTGGIFVLWKLLPHGIFEIPAVLISIAVGLRLGMFLFVSKKKDWKEFKKWIIDAFRVFVLIVIPLLIIAAVIEGSLIVWLG